MTAHIFDRYLHFAVQLLPLCIAVAAYFAYKRVVAKRDNPPCYGGWIPWIGCALEFGKAPLLFIDTARKKYGSVFTLKVAGERLTFITDPADFPIYFKTTSISFQGAVQKPVSKIASIPKKSFEAFHMTMHDMVKHRLAPAKLEEFFPYLCLQFNKRIDKALGMTGTGQGNLHTLIRCSMYPAILDSLMGSNVLPTESEADFKLLEEHFIRFDDQFEYGSQLPAFLLRDWSQSRSWLLRLFKEIVRKVPLSSSEVSGHQTILQSLLAIVDQDCAPNFSLLLMWASLANAIPLTFWTLSYILSSEDILAEVRTEIASVLATRAKDAKGDVQLTLADLQRVPSVKRCVLEAVRLHSPGAIPRRVMQPLTLHGYVIPEGDLLLLSPYWAHRDVQFFPEPEAFKPDRWKKAELDKNLFLDGFVGFGGGRYQCPGRWFGLMEIHLFIVLLLHSYDIKLNPPATVPKPSPLHLVGTQLPVTPLTVSFSRSH